MRCTEHEPSRWRLAAVVLGAAACGCMNQELAETDRVGLCPALELRFDRQISERAAWAVGASVSGFAASVDTTLYWPSPWEGSVTGDFEMKTARVWFEYAALGDPARSYEYGVTLNVWSLTHTRFLYQSGGALVCVEEVRRSTAARLGVFFRAVIAPGVRVRIEETLGFDIAESLAALELRLGPEARLLVGWRAYRLDLTDSAIALDGDVFGGKTVALSVRF